MKKSFRLIALLLALSIVAFTLCSCEWLNEKKANRAEYSDDKTEITYQGNVYKVLLHNNLDFISDYSYSWGNPTVTTKDIPLLLTESYGRPVSVLRDGAVLSVFADFDDYSDDFWVTDEGKEYYATSTYLYYVRSDKYDDLKNTINNAALDHYYFEYTGYDYSTDMLNESRPYTSECIQVKLDDDLTDIVNKALKADTKDMVSYKSLSSGDYDVSSIDIRQCDKDLIITKSGIQYYLIRDRHKDVFYFWDGNHFEEECLYPLSESDSKSVDALFEKYPNAVSLNNIKWQFEGSDNTDKPIDDLQY